MWIGFKKKVKTDVDTEEKFSSTTEKEIPRILKRIATTNPGFASKLITWTINNKPIGQKHNPMLYGTPIVNSKHTWMDKYPDKTKTHIIQFESVIDNQKYLIQIWAIGLDSWRSLTDVEFKVVKLDHKEMQYDNLDLLDKPELVKPFHKSVYLDYKEDVVYKPFTSTDYMEPLTKALALKKIPTVTRDSKDVYDLLLSRGTHFGSLKELERKLPELFINKHKMMSLLNNTSVITPIGEKGFPLYKLTKLPLMDKNNNHKVVGAFYLDFSLPHPNIGSTYALYALIVHYNASDESFYVEPYFIDDN